MLTVDPDGLHTKYRGLSIFYASQDTLTLTKISGYMAD